MLDRPEPREILATLEHKGFAKGTEKAAAVILSE
jgi:hypothetical protein